MRTNLIYLLIYLVGGLLINYGSIFIVWGTCLRMCKGDIELYRAAKENNMSKGCGFFGRFPLDIRPLLVFFLWPINVYDTLRIGIGAIKEVKASRQARFSRKPPHASRQASDDSRYKQTL